MAVRLTMWAALGLSVAALAALLIFFIDVIPFAAAIDATRSGDPEAFDINGSIVRARLWTGAVAIPLIAYAGAVVLAIRRSRHRLFFGASAGLLSLVASVAALGWLL